jgi:dienelactone hydrolase
MALAPYARAFAQRGAAALVFDYRRWGQSDGAPRNVLYVTEQLEDYRTALAWARAQAGVDPARVVVWGTSFAGACVRACRAMCLRADARCRRTRDLARGGGAPRPRGRDRAVPVRRGAARALDARAARDDRVGAARLRAPGARRRARVRADGRGAGRRRRDDRARVEGGHVRAGGRAAVRPASSRSCACADERAGTTRTSYARTSGPGARADDGRQISASSMFEVPLYDPSSGAARTACPLLLVPPRADALCLPDRVDAIRTAARAGLVRVCAVPGGTSLWVNEGRGLMCAQITLWCTPASRSSRCRWRRSSRSSRRSWGSTRPSNNQCTVPNCIQHERKPLYI